MSYEQKCPNGCGPLEPYCEADIGVGVQSYGPWGCPVCHYVEDDGPGEEDGLWASGWAERSAPAAEVKL